MPADGSDLLTQFEAGAIKPAQFHHREHVRVSYELLERHPFPEALLHLARGLRRLAAKVGKPEIYHETITAAFLALIAERRLRDRYVDFEDFAARNPDLLRKGLLEKLYDPALLRSSVARQTFILPRAQLRSSSIGRNKKFIPGALAFLTLALLTLQAQGQNSVQSFNPPMPNKYADEAALALDDRNYQKGIATLTAGLAARPPAKAAAVLHELRAWAYMELEDYARACEDSEEALRLDPAIEAGHWNCAEANFHAGRYSAAVAHFTKALAKKSPPAWKIYGLRGQAYEKLGQRDLARRDYEMAIARPMKQALDHSDRAFYLEKLGQYQRAAEDLATAKQRRPRDPVYLNLLAWCGATPPSAEVRDGKAAVQNATLACERSKWKEPNYVDTLAAAEAESGHFADAVGYQKRAIALQNDLTKRKSLQKHLALFEKGKPLREDPAIR